MMLRVDARELAALIVETGRPSPRDDHDGRALFVSGLQAPLLDAFLRLVHLLDTQDEIPVLAPLARRELYYRLLQGDQQGRLAEVAIGDGRLRPVAGAIAWIREHYAEPLQVETLSERVSMSPSALHAHFSAPAGVSPIQIREAVAAAGGAPAVASGRDERGGRRLRSGLRESVAVQPGEYARIFGQLPRRDAEAMRSDAASYISLTSTGHK